MGTDLEITTIDAFVPVGAVRPYVWWDEAQKLQERYPDWIVTYDLSQRRYTALCFKYLDLSWITGQSPEHMAYVIEEVMRKEIPWDYERR